MSFATFKEKSVSQKTALIEMELGRAQGMWFNYQAGIWYYQFNTYRHVANHSFLRGNFCYGSFLRSGVSESGNNETPVKIGSLMVDGEEYTEKTSIANCIAANKSWYYDVNKTRLYVRYNNYDEPGIHTTVIGFTFGISNRAININDIFYEPRLEGLSTISKSKDTLYFGLVSFDSASLQFNNADGLFDNIINNYLFGQSIEIKYGGDTEAYANYRDIFKGYIESLPLNYEQCNTSLVDNRKKLSKTIPTRSFSQTAYTNLEDDNVGKPIPLIWGSVYNIPIICTNEAKSTAGNYTFKVCDVTDHTTGIKDIVQIYVDGIATTWASESLVNATFEITTGNYTAGQQVTGDIQGYAISGAMDDNSLDVIEDLLNTYQSISYTSNNYNTTEWASEKTDAYDVGIFINEEKEIIDVIEDIAVSNFGIFLIQDDGRYTWRTFDSATTATDTIEQKEYLEMPEIQYDGLEFLTSCRIGYRKDWKNKDFAWYENTDYESDIYYRYVKYQSKDFETVLTSNTDAYQLSESIMDYMDSVPARIKVKTAPQNIDLEIGDVVNFNIDRINKDWMGDVKVEIIGTEKDIVTNVVTLTGREI